MSNVGCRGLSAPLIDLSNDLAVEVSHAMKRRGLRVSDLKRFGYSDRSCDRISAWLRGAQNSESFGVEAALRLAGRLAIPVRCLVGDEAREVA